MADSDEELTPGIYSGMVVRKDPDAGTASGYRADLFLLWVTTDGNQMEIPVPPQDATNLARNLLADSKAVMISREVATAAEREFRLTGAEDGRIIR